ncbi:NepR family anti-sigma factor [Rhizobium sp. NFR03]|uniref:NepR family anti-sigma factor n=1 Tax=Rhizobium sp. NFR03 TaxID=1566263 RepID=UPI0008B4579B|nr:NepR family anti-sigma factor [Rhizobium sp. NFR03]SER95270.1 hypothetical protein SAMN03159406_01720 [Rhizobium sp. NFR03]
MADTTDPKPRPVLQRAETMDPNSQIVSKLRAFYSAVEQEPLPDTFLDLLQQLDTVEKARKG